MLCRCARLQTDRYGWLRSETPLVSSLFRNALSNGKWNWACGLDSLWAIWSGKKIPLEWIWYWMFYSFVACLSISFESAACRHGKCYVTWYLFNLCATWVWEIIIVIIAIANLIIICSTDEMWFEKNPVTLSISNKSWVRCWDGFVAGMALVPGWHCGYRSWT